MKVGIVNNIKIGKYYTISGIDVNTVWMILIDDNRYLFSLNKGVWDYFYKSQKVRKLKLKQLNKC